MSTTIESLCKKCGAPAEPGLIFCKKCGAAPGPIAPLIRTLNHAEIGSSQQVETPSRDRFKGSPGLWVLIAAVVILNLWFDYYHPLGIIFDVIIAPCLLVKYLNQSR